MSRTIDHRIVEMRFDNKQFEAGAKQTMGTLTKLKEALKLPNTAKALEGIDKATKDIRLDGIAAGVEALEKRFSTFGIVGMRVIENITDGLMGKLHTAVNFVTNSIVSGGIKRAMNIENAHFQLQALLKDETKVQAVMADAMESVDGTAYAYDEAARAASQFSASGVQAGEDMLGALKGITGVAAMTNSDFESIASIFTTVAGNGRLMGDQLLQLSSRGLNAASTLTDYFKEVRGQAGMTEGQVREMVSKGKISFKDFSDAMTWAFGDSAKRANETFTGAFSNMKSALARIGAEFISPLVEQNGELVNLFNALRIKINDVKSAIAFDEQRSAIAGMTDETGLMVDAIGRLTKDGSIGFNTFTDAIIGTSDTLENYDEINGRISSSFEKVKESGELTSDALKEFNESGIHATSSLRAFLNGVNSGSIKVKNTTRALVREITNGRYVMDDDIEKLAQNGKINFDIFSASIVNSSQVVKKETDFMSTAFKGLFASVKKEGHLTTDIYSDLSQSGIDAGSALEKYMNGVANGTIRASYSTRQAIDELRNGVDFTTGDIFRMVKEGQISFDIFQSAMEKAYGTEKTLAKQVTDGILDTLKSIVTWVNELDMTKPMEVFYYGIESIKNAAKGLYSVISPLGRAFSEVFLSFSGDDVVTFAEAIERLTARLKLSEKGSKNLHDAFKGIFDVAKLVGDTLFKMASALFSINKPIGSVGDGFLDLIGFLGRGLSDLVEWVRSLTLLKKAFNLVTGGIRYSMDSLTKLIDVGKNFVSQLTKLEGVNKFINSINKAFIKLGTMATPYVEDFIQQLKEMVKSFLFVGDFNFDDVLGNISGAFSNFADKLDNFTVSSPAELIEKMVDKIKSKLGELHDLAMSNEGFASFVNNMIEYASQLREALSYDNIFERVDKIMEIFGKFFNWIKETVGPSLKDFNAGSVVAAGGGLGMVYAFIKASKAFESLSKSIKSIPDLLGGVKKTLEAYQNDLNASAIMKVAGAIAILAGALVILSFADPKRLLAASGALSLLAGVLLVGITKFMQAMNKGKELNDAVRIFAKGLKSSMKKIGRALEIKALGSAIKDFAKSVVLIAGSIIALGIMYQKDPEALNAGVELVKQIMIAMTVIMGSMMILSSLIKPKKMKNFQKAALSVLIFAGSLTLMVNALSNLFNLEFPEDWKFKLAILGGLFAGLAGLSIVLALAARISGKGEFSANTVGAFAALLVSAVLSLDKLFKMEFPADWQTKLGVLSLIFAELGALMIVLGVASRLAGGAIKATGTLLAMSVFLGTIVVSLMVLTKIPEDKLLNGAKALGVILTTLGVALYGAGNIATKDSAKAVLSMAILVGTITASLAVLAMVPVPLLLKSAVALGSMLMVLAVDFLAVSKIANEKVYLTVGSFAAIIVEIAYSLFVLAEQPWEGLLAAGVSLSAVLLSLAGAMRIVSGMKDLKSKNLGLLMTATLAFIPIGVALLALSNQPWDGMLSAASSLSIVLMSLAVTLDMVSKIDGLSTKKIAEFVLATTTLLIPIGTALYVLAERDWAGMLAGGVALSEVLLAMSVAFGIVSASKPDTKAIAAFAVASGSVSLIALSLTVLATQDWANLLAAGTALSEVLLAMSVSMGICAAIGPIGEEALAGMLVLDAFAANFMAVLAVFGLITKSEEAKALLAGGVEVFGIMGEAIGAFIGGIAGGVIEGISGALPQLGLDLSMFMANLAPFIMGAKMIDNNVLSSVGILTGIIVALTATEIINGIAGLFGLSLVDVANELSSFMVALLPFIISSKMLSEDAINACATLATMILTLTGAELLNGIATVLGFTGSFADFGDQLMEFGKAIVPFSILVSGVKEDSVKGAAAAGEIMATLANKLPGTGGIIQQIFGEKDLGEFGKQLLAFGAAILPFSILVSGVKEDSVKGAAAAGTIMAELADKLPAQGGLSQTIFGEKNLADFGDQLKAFGEAVVPFAEQVADVKASSIQGVRTITTVMTSLANDLPDTQSLWGKIFGGDKSSLSGFGLEIEKFGKSMANFSGHVSNINYSQISNTITEFKNLVSFAQSIDANSSSIIVEFVNGLGDIGEKSVDKFVKALANSNSKINSSITEMINNVITAISSKSSQFTRSGQDSATFWINGIKSKFTLAFSIGIELAKRVIEAIKSMENQFKKAGESSILAFISGIEGMNAELEKAGTETSKIVVKSFKDVEDEFSKSGENAVDGFVEAISKKMPEISKLGKQIGDALAKSAKKSLDEHSPSKRMGKIADYAGIGFIKNLVPYVQKAYDAGEEIGNAVYDGSYTSIQLVKEMSDPVIHPSMDLNGVRKSMDEINAMFNDAMTITMASTYDISEAMNHKKRSNEELLSDNISKLSKSINTAMTRPNNYTVNGVTYRENDDVENAVKSLINAVVVQRRV